MAEFGRRYAGDTVIAADHGAITLVESSIASIIREDYLNTLEATLTADVSPLLTGVAIPALVIVGTEDRRAPPDVARRLANGIVGAAYQEVDGAGHLAMLDNPASFNQLLRSFLLRASKSVSTR